MEAVPASSDVTFTTRYWGAVTEMMTWLLPLVARSIAMRDWLPAWLNVAEKVPTPLVRPLMPGRDAVPSELEN